MVGHHQYSADVEADGFDQAAYRPGEIGSPGRWKPTTACTSANCWPGRDVARNDPVARQMVNFVYLIGDRATGEALQSTPPTTSPAST